VNAALWPQRAAFSDYVPLSGRFTLLCMGSSPPRAPAGLGDHGRKVWRDVVAKYVLDPGETAVLGELCRTLDELDRLNAAAAVAPLSVPGSRGQETVNPLFAEVRAHRKTVELLQRALALPVEGERVGSVRNPHRRAAVASRWRRDAALKARA